MSATPRCRFEPHRLTGRRLQRIRADWFYRYPLCVTCQKHGRVRLATELDHIKPLEEGGDDFDCDDEQNRQGLCRQCHLDKTAKDRGYVAKGGDANGMPTDPRHPWNQG